MSAAKQQQQQQQQQQQLHRHDSQLQRMSSISQYIERRPSDPNCLQQAASPTFESPLDKNLISGSGRRSLPEMQGGSLIGPSAATTTISIGGNGMLPRKSALKQVCFFIFKNLVVLRGLVDKALGSGVIICGLLSRPWQSYFFCWLFLLFRVLHRGSI